MRRRKPHRYVIQLPPIVVSHPARPGPALSLARQVADAINQTMELGELAGLGLPRATVSRRGPRGGLHPIKTRATPSTERRPGGTP